MYDRQRDQITRTLMQIANPPPAMPRTPQTPQMQPQQIPTTQGAQPQQPVQPVGPPQAPGAPMAGQAGMGAMQGSPQIGGPGMPQPLPPNMQQALQQPRY